MMRYLHIYLAVIISLSLAAGSVYQVHADEFDPAREFAVNLINQIRMDPVGYAQGLGTTSEDVEYSLPMLALDANVTGVAAEENNTETEKTANWATPALAMSFSGVVSFLNFMSLEAAVQIVVDNQFQRELSPDFAGPRIILNPELSLAGVAISIGATSGEAVWYNAYSVTITLASALTRVERQLVNLANQLRYDPIAMAAVFLGSPESYLPLYLPVFWDSELQQSADALVLKSMGGEGEDGGAAAEATAEQDDSVSVSSVVAGEAFPKSDVDTTVGWLFSALLLEDLKTVESDRVLLNAQVRRLGVGNVLVEGEAYNHVRSVLVGEFLAPEAAGDEVTDGVDTDTAVSAGADVAEARIYGLAYLDTDLSGLYSPGEGWQGKSVVVYDADTFVCVADKATDAAGHFDLSLPSGHTYIVIVSDGLGQVAEAQIYLDRDRFLSIRQVVE